MLYQLMKECNNFFPHSWATGAFQIDNGEISLHMLDGQYYIIEGSVFNDGLHQYHYDALTDESFNGTVIMLAVPKAFVELANEIEEWVTKSGGVSAFQSESFGGYSYTRATGKNGGQITWKDAFADRLMVWRKI